MANLRECLQAAPAPEAAESVGLLSSLDAPATEKWLGDRLHDWPRTAQDRALRLVAGAGTPERAWLLLSIFDRLDPLLHPLAVDEISISGDASAVPMLLHLAAGNSEHGGAYLRLKAVEGLGRLRAPGAAPLLREIAESKRHWRWLHPSELRLAAFQALSNINPMWAQEFFPRSGFTVGDFDLRPCDPVQDAPRFRQRRYPRFTLKEPIPATAASDRETIALEIREVTLSGGRAICEKHITPGTLVSLKIGSGLRPIRAQAFLRDARAQGIGFEIASMDLDERMRLRRLIRENGIVAAPIPTSAPQSAQEQNAVAHTHGHS